jgi:hypothetical protein
VYSAGVLELADRVVRVVPVGGDGPDSRMDPVRPAVEARAGAGNARTRRRRDARKRARAAKAAAAPTAAAPAVPPPVEDPVVPVAQTPDLHVAGEQLAGGPLLPSPKRLRSEVPPFVPASSGHCSVPCCHLFP